MRIITRTLLALGLAALPGVALAQGSFTIDASQVPANADNEPAAVHPVPTPRQLKWQQTEFYAFFHYGMNTYTGLEWGNGDEAESRFAPTLAPNPKQWLEAVKAAGMKGGIAVVKHHDGFCLWPTETTNHSVKNAGNQNGRETNVPRDFAQAAKELDMKYGFYISPWDRNSGLYGTDDYVSKVFLKQCAELAQYGTDQFEMWFDGANGGTGYYGGKGGNINVGNATTYYDTPNLRDSVHKVCPDCVLWGVGGEARWIGNEKGFAGETNWCTAPTWGSGGTNGLETGWIWCAGESDAKATNSGWFYHDGEQMLSADRLFQMYLETVGRNATLILNCPPNKAGKLPQADVTQLAALGEMLKTRLSTNLAEGADIQVSDTRAAGANRNYSAANLVDGDWQTYWATNDGVKQATITITFSEPKTVHYVELMEYVKLGQRVKSFGIEISADGTSWKQAGAGVETTTVGYKRIVPLNGSTSASYDAGKTAKAIRIKIKDSKACPLLSRVAVY